MKYISLFLLLFIIFKTTFDSPVFLQHNRMTGDFFGKLPQTGSFICHLERLPLPSSTYSIGFSVMSDGEYLDRIDDAFELTVIEGDFFGSGEVPPISHGVCLVKAKWSLSFN